jgi:EAL domain-containing protein (putative c-di-GMP-specific phosphodiesterase class I)
VFDAEMHARSLDLLSLETSLRRAVEQHEFQVAYQPIVDLRRNTVQGFESLVRWQDPERGWIPPDQFIRLAEETGLVTRIDQWMLRQSLIQLSNWHAQGYPDLTISVNLSARSLQNPNLPQMVANLLHESQVRPECLVLEITESAVMRDVESAVQILQAIHALGVKIAIDDFGTGYSSLGYLHRLPAHILKIDRSFVHDVTENADAAALASAVIAIGRILGMRVVAEGVETEAQRAFLLDHNCDAIQGYLISRPQPAKALEAMLAETTQQF